MSKIFGFDLHDKSKELTDKEYVNLVNRIRGNFLIYVVILDTTLSVIISDLFLQDKNDFPLWQRQYLMKIEYIIWYRNFLVI